MAGRLAKEIKQTKPWRLAEEEAFLNLARTYEHIELRIGELFKTNGLSHTQYNVLRILRGSHPDGVTCGQIADRMVTHDPDITRLLDRMESRGLVSRERSKEDRRVVLTNITQQGIQLVNSLDRPLEQSLKQQFEKLSERDTQNLIRLLELLREEG